MEESITAGYKCTGIVCYHGDSLVCIGAVYNLYKIGRLFAKLLSFSF